MYTQDPKWFDKPNDDEVEREIDKSYPDYEENPIDWTYLIKLEKRQIFFNSIDELLNKYHFKYKYFPSSERYRIWFKDQTHLNQFNIIWRKSKLLQNLVPWRIYTKIDSCGCMDYHIKKY